MFRIDVNLLAWKWLPLGVQPLKMRNALLKFKTLSIAIGISIFLEKHPCILTNYLPWRFAETIIAQSLSKVSYSHLYISLKTCYF